MTMSDSTIDEEAVLNANQKFYEALSAGSIEGISAACAHDPDVTALHETSTEVAVGWPAVLDTWKAVPFEVLRRTLLCDDKAGYQGPRVGRMGCGFRERSRKDEERRGFRAHSARHEYL